MVIGFFLAVRQPRGANRVACPDHLPATILMPGIVIGAIWKPIYNPEFG
ncbi:MAG: hypothetical protein IPI73_30730 [Betaproteobacteria bacterium]|nr:hypothetical protein [Betaproteobacteria bacterium]